MKVLLSPAKSLDLNLSFQLKILYVLKKRQNTLINFKKKVQRLTDLMGVSSKIADLNYERNNIGLCHLPRKIQDKQYMHLVGMFRGLDAYSINDDKIEFMQSTVRIISGLYGLLSHWISAAIQIRNGYKTFF